MLIKFLFLVQQQLEALREARRNKVLPSSSQSSSTCSSSSSKGEKRVDLQKKQQQPTDGPSCSGSKDAAVKEFLIDDPLHFSVLELSAKNQQLLQRQQLQQLQQQLAGGSQQQQQLVGNAGLVARAADGGIGFGIGAIGGHPPTLPFSLTLDEQKRKVDAGYVSLKDTYTACSSVYGVGGSSSSSSSSSNNDACKSAGNGATEIFSGNDLRPAKIGRMMTAAAAAVVASHGSKTTTVSGAD